MFFPLDGQVFEIVFTYMNIIQKNLFKKKYKIMWDEWSMLSLLLLINCEI